MRPSFQEQLNSCPQVFVSTVSMDSNNDQELNSHIKTQQCVMNCGISHVCQSAGQTSKKSYLVG